MSIPTAPEESEIGRFIGRNFSQNPITTEEFKEIDSALSRIFRQNPTMEGFFAAKDSYFSSDPAKRKAYHAYMIAGMFPQYAPGGWQKVVADSMSRQQFVETVDRMNFLDVDQQVQFRIDCLNAKFRPWIPMGRTEDHIHRLMPTWDVLRPHRGRPDTILGINTSVQPPQPFMPAHWRKRNMTDESNASDESGEATGAPGFIFHQLGRLEAAAFFDDAPLNADVPCEVEEENLEWINTGFCVVAELSLAGNCMAIWVVFDFSVCPADLYDTYTGDDFRRINTVRRKMTGGAEGDWGVHDWGVPPSPEGEEGFSCARIGATMAECDGRGFAGLLSWGDQKVKTPAELVRTLKVMGGPGAIRATDGQAWVRGPSERPAPPTEH